MKNEYTITQKEIILLAFTLLTLITVVIYNCNNYGFYNSIASNF
jgi:hypothetical protein